jgi:hypothetical protein
MDADALGPEAAALQRARLHIRGGKRRLRQGKISIGILTLYDALLMALEWYFFSSERRKGLLIKEGDDLNNDRTAFDILRRSGRLDDSLDYEAFDLLVEKALIDEMLDYDYTGVLKGFESVMTQLGVMPFDEAGLPPEDPSTE